MSENRCVSCGEIIPEGRMVCPICESFPEEPSICDSCENGDHWECHFCCAKCYEDYGDCPNPDCDPMDI